MCLSIHIRSLQEHVQLSLTDTCQSYPVLLRTGPNNYIEYKAASQSFTANVRYVESRQNHRSQKWLLIAQTGHRGYFLELGLSAKFRTLIVLLNERL